MNRKLKTVIKLRIGIAAAFMIFGTANLLAQQQVTLKMAIEQALQNKAEAKKAQLEIKRAELKVTEAKAGALPKINATAGLTYNPLIQSSLLEFGGQRITAQLGQPWSSSAVVTLNQTIFDQRVFIGLKAAKSTREFYVLNAQLSNEQIIENVALAYYQVFVQEENLKTVIDSYTNTEKVRNVIKSLVDNGLAKSIDLDRTNVQLTNINSNKQQLINTVELSKNSLKFYMGIPIDKPIELEEKSIIPKPELISGGVNFEDLTNMKVLNKNKELLQYSLKSTKAILYPTISLTANYGWGASGGKFPLANGINNGVLWSDYSAIGLNINVPIFNGFANKSKIQQAEIDLLSLDQDIEQTKLSVSLDYKNSVANIENSIITIENMKGNVELAEKVQSNTQSNYQYGLATLTDVLDSQNALTEAKKNYTTSLLDYKQAEIKLIKAKGELNTLQNQ